MLKDFNSWNGEKKNLENTGFDELPFHEREIWWCSIGINLGDEQDGKNELFERPILVVKKFNRKLAWYRLVLKRKRGFIITVLNMRAKYFRLFYLKLNW